MRFLKSAKNILCFLLLISLSFFLFACDDLPADDFYTYEEIPAPLGDNTEIVVEGKEVEETIEINGNRFTPSHYFRYLMAEKPALKDISVTKLCMLGSHDTFTDKINMHSRLDTANENDFSTNEDLSSLFKAVYVQLAKAQADDAYVQLRAGVRYLDMRISKIGEELYNCHTLISDKLSNSLTYVLKFLDENPGEFVILNIHKYYGDDTDSLFLENYMRKVTYNGKNIFDYIRYGQDVTSVSDLSYNDLTDNGVNAGILLFSNAGGDEACHPIFNQFPATDIFMPTIDTIDSDEKIAYLVSIIPDANASEGLCLAQAQTTPSSDDILGVALSGSLLEKAKGHNDYFLNSEYFDEILDAFPIIKFDYVTYNETGFVDKILQKMVDKTLSLVQ